MSDKRISKRKESLFYLKVVDHASGELVGRLVDITADGFKLISKNKITLNEEFNLALELPAAFEGQEQMLFNATSLHSEKDVNPEYTVTGFRFIALSRENSKNIHRLMKEYIFDN